MAWLLARSPNMLLIPGATTVAELEEHLAACALELDPVDLAELDSFGDTWAPGPGTAVPTSSRTRTEEQP
jgi:aryl-alcohol dehydrogenase-like predicted oxidoreductase